MISTKLLRRYAEKISTPEPSSVWIPYFRCIIISFSSLHVKNQSLLGSERKGWRDKYQGHVSNAWDYQWCCHHGPHNFVLQEALGKVYKQS